MKFQSRISTLFLVFLFVFACQTSKTTVKRHHSKHYEPFELQTLTDSLTPVMMPFNRWIDPAGHQVYFGNRKGENHALDCALSPDGKWVAIEERRSIVILSTQTNKVVHTFLLSDVFEKVKLLSTYSGIQWHEENGVQSVYMSASGDGGKSHVIKADWNGKHLEVDKTFMFEPVKPAKDAIANELVISDENGVPFLYVVLNGNNTLEKVNTHTGETVWSVPTGVAPYGISLANSKLYVTNWAGGVPEEGDENVAGVPWGSAKVDPKTGATREGTVSVFNPANGALLKEIVVGLHPNDIISSADENFVYVANANSDEVSVINTKTDAVSETVSVRLGEEENPYWGDSPNGLGITSDGKTLFVANGIDNAVAVVNLGKDASVNSLALKSQLAGFIPTGAYPGAACVYQDSRLYVPNIESEGSRIPSISEETGVVSYNSHRLIASLSVIDIPDQNQLDKYTERVHHTNQSFRIALSRKLPRKNAKPVPMPLRIGEPSVFKHAVYIIKENRTYDQILGDIPTGNGEPSLCVFGEEVTPNTHKIVKEFMLLDNFHVSGKSSAEGHQWTDMAIVTDWISKNVNAWFRSYPHIHEDALVYAPTGFIWDNAIRHGKSVRIYGEACRPDVDKNETWETIYNRYLRGEKTEFTNTSTISTVPPILCPDYSGYGTHKFSDVERADVFIKELKEYEEMEGDQWPELLILALPNDHTAGTRPGVPTPRAMVADNDVALARIIEAISKSKFWPTTAIFVTEDDSQSGWDHVSAYRTVGMVVSPYSRLGKTVSTNYNQVSLVRSIEQILGMSPMNIMDATAMPMFDCFTDKPDFSPFTALPNNIPINEMNKELSELSGRELELAEQSIKFFDAIDSGSDEEMNTILWRALKGDIPYPKVSYKMITD
jgi:YVTN family beta-propeller protein